MSDYVSSQIPSSLLLQRCGHVEMLLVRTRQAIQLTGITRTRISHSARMSSEASGSSKPPTLVMQIIIRRDLQTDHNWPIGPLMAQAAHAATAVLAEYKDNEEVKRYLGDLGNMRKVVMEVPNEEGLKGLTKRLDTLEPRVPYHLWIEQPENTPTALALVPNPRPKALKKIFSELDITLWK